MSNDTPTQSTDRLDQIIADYLAAEESGDPPSPEEVIAAYPDLADELRRFFANRKELAGALPGEPPRRQFVPPKVRYFGDYELLDEIARGGMGVVYRAKQTSLNRIVALKMILSGHLASDDDVKRFRTEAEAAANLKHPGIVSVHEVGVHEGHHYFSMDYIKGRSLAEIVRENPLPARKAAEYVRSIADAVHYAHQQGTLHRDLKPSNILIDHDDRVHVTDFGLAVRVEGDSELTRTGQVLGTPSYMSPEQAQGKRGLIGPASDVYSMGVILYELLTGRPPFRAESSVETLQQVIESEPVSPRRLNSRIPRDLETICLKCLRKELHKRYVTAGELADDVGRFLKGEPITARPVGRIERTWRWCRRNPVLAGLNAALAVSIVIGFTGITLQWYRADSERQTAEQAASELRDEQLARSRLEGDLTELEARRLSLNESVETLQAALLTEQTQYDELNTSLREIQERFGENLITLAEDATRKERVGTARQYLNQCPVDSRDGRWHALKQRIDQEGRIVERNEHMVLSRDEEPVASAGEFGISLPETVTHLTPSSNLRRLAYVAGLNHVRIWDVVEARHLPSFFTPSEVNGLTFSADSTRLACLYGEETSPNVVIWNLVTFSKEYFLRLPSSNVSDIDFAMQGRSLLTGSGADVTLWEVPPIDDVTTRIARDIATLEVGIHDWPQSGGSRFRNNVPIGIGIPAKWDVESHQNILWEAPIHSRFIMGNPGDPIVANGKVFIGTSNRHGYVSRFPEDVDLGVLLCLDERSGRFLWQYSSHKLPAGAAHDWPKAGICATPVVDADRLWVVTNRCEVVCLDTEGFQDGENDGPYTAEEHEHVDEADVIWKFDMIGELGVSPHTMSTSAAVIVDDRLFLCTSNAVDESHVDIPAPHAPSFIALERDTGQVVWTDNSPGSNILHGQWASPAYGVFDGQAQVIFSGGDGWLYSFDPAGDGDGNSRLLWKFDCNPKTALYSVRGRSERSHIMKGAMISNGLVYVAVGEDPSQRAPGNGHLWCIDPTKRGDVSAELAFDPDDNSIPPRRLQCVDAKAGEYAAPNPNSAAVWHFTGEDANGNGELEFGERMYRCVEMPAIRDGLLYVADYAGVVHCLDAESGTCFWWFDMFSSSWSSPLVVDGKVYVANEDGEVLVFEHGPDLKILAVNDMGNAVYTTPIVANNVLYVASQNMLYAIAEPPEAGSADEAEGAKSADQPGGE